MAQQKAAYKMLEGVWSYSKTKFDNKSWKSVLLGYESMGYKVWDVQIEKYIVFRDVIVDETNFLISRPKDNNEGTISSNFSETDVYDKSKLVSKIWNS